MAVVRLAEDSREKLECHERNLPSPELWSRRIPTKKKDSVQCGAHFGKAVRHFHFAVEGVHVGFVIGKVYSRAWLPDTNTGNFNTDRPHQQG